MPTPIRKQASSGSVLGTTIREEHEAHFTDVMENKGEGVDVEKGGSLGKKALDGARGMPQMLPEYRMRLLTGLKQCFKSKYEEGVLGAKVRSTRCWTDV